MVIQDRQAWIVRIPSRTSSMPSRMLAIASPNKVGWPLIVSWHMGPSGTVPQITLLQESSALSAHDLWFCCRCFLRDARNWNHHHHYHHHHRGHHSKQVLFLSYPYSLFLIGLFLIFSLSSSSSSSFSVSSLFSSSSSFSVSSSFSSSSSFFYLLHDMHQIFGRHSVHSPVLR